MITNRNTRNYEVSIWTLQDSFITVLKEPNLEHKGQIEEPQLTISDDSENTFSFKIPMHIIRNNERIENPIWYNTQNGVIVANMRKIKVIFNRQEEAERVFEFVIVKVTETHEGFETYCEVESEELAFHELGKVGYKVDLSADLFNMEYDEWAESVEGTDENVEEEPVNNINYWVDKVLDGTLWEYGVQMKHEGYTEDECKSNTIYEDEYAENWQMKNGHLVPSTIIDKKEKLRLIDENNSNRYNLLQSIAETFGVFCKFEYMYDENYHIIGRKVIFYDNYINDDDSTLDLTYHYDTESVSRELDATDLTTKMLVLVDSNDELINNSITETSANPMLEDYLLNFDYLYNIGTITKEQYEEIENYKIAMHNYNTQLKALNDKIIYYEDILTNTRATLETAKQSLILDQEGKQEEEAYIRHLLDSSNNYTKDAKFNGLKIEKEGVYLYGSRTFSPRHDNAVGGTLAIYYDTSGNYKMNTSEYVVTYSDDNTFIEEIKVNQTTYNNSPLSVVYIDYEYNPDLYHKMVREQWIKKINTDGAIVAKNQPIVDILDGERDANDELKDSNKPGLIQECKDKFDEINLEKNELISKFENMMGPALREGTWQPEDDYAKYSDKKVAILGFNTATEDLSLIWDKDLFDEEETNYIESGVNKEKIYYPCIDLSNLYAQNASVEEKRDLDLLIEGIQNPMVTSGPTQDETNPNATNIVVKTFGFAFQEQDINQEMKVLDVSYGFVSNDNGVTVKPVAFLTGFYDYYNNSLFKDTSDPDNPRELSLDEVIEKLIGTYGGHLGYLINTTQTITNTSSGETSMTTTITTSFSEGISHCSLLENQENYKIVYPRIKINNSSFKNSSDEFNLKYNGIQLNEYEDFYILSKYADSSERDWSTITVDSDEPNKFSYYLTINPEFLLSQENYINKDFVFSYALSNTGLMIYLDAVKILKENSVPKVTYSITPKVVKKNIIDNLYDRIHQLVHINDYELKFENVTGYISNITMDLDKPWEDEIEIKNYKNKFEDLFSSIVASTAQIEKNSAALNAAASAFSATGQISTGVLQQSMNMADLNLAFNNGKLTINEQNGIWAISDSGAVAFNGGGIFTATEKDPGTGNWIWNTGILPRGISANAITAGRLDTNLVRVYAGDDLRFQLNGDGLFAYKAWMDDFDKLKAADQGTVLTDVGEYNGMDPGQYVVHNANGLFLIAAEGSRPIYDVIQTTPKEINGKTFNWPIYDEKGDVFTIETRLEDKLDKEVKRVEISWSGLKLRNWKGEETFYADPDTGDLIIGGTLLQDASYMTVPQEVMDDINDDLDSQNTTNSIQNTPNRMLKSGIRLLGDEPTTSQITELSKDEKHTIKEYLINELANDRIKEINHQDEEKKVHFLTPNVAAVKIGDYIDWKAISISNEIVEDALESRGRIESRLNSVADIINQNIGYKYTPALKNINNPIQVSTLPDNLNDTTDLYKVYEISSTQEKYWWDGTEWQQLEPNNINLGTGASLNLIGANATFMAGSELKMLAGGDLHIFGGNVYISNSPIGENETEESKLQEIPTNGIVMDDNGLAIYSNKNITVGVVAKTPIAVENSSETVNISSGFELDSLGNFTVVTTSDNNNKDIGAIKFYRFDGEQLRTGVVIDGSGFTVNTGGTFNVQSSNFILNNTATNGQPLMRIVQTDANDNVVAGLHFSAGGDLTVTGIINATSGKIGGWTIGNNGIIYTENSSNIAGFIPRSANSTDNALWIGSNFRVEGSGNLHASGADITGTISATSGKIGGWTIGSNYFGNANTLANSTIGFHINTGDNIVLWAGNTRGNDPPFSITANGFLIARNANITGTVSATTVNALGITDTAFGWTKVTGIDYVYANQSTLQYGRLGKLIFLRGSFVHTVQNGENSYYFGTNLPKGANNYYGERATTLVGYWTNISDLGMNGIIYCHLYNNHPTTQLGALYVDDIRRENGDRLKQADASYIYCYFNTFYTGA